MEDADDDRRNPPLLPSNYVTLVQLQERWLQEKQRKQREKEEQEEQERKMEKEEQEKERQKHKEQQKANLQKRQAESITTLPRRNRCPPLRTNRWIPSEKSSTQFRAVVVYDGESKSDAFMKKNKNWEKGKQIRGKPRGEEDLIGGTEQLLVQKEDLSEENHVVSTESGCEKEIGGKCEAVSSSGGKRGNRRHRMGVKNRGKPRVEEDLSNGKEQLAKNEVEAENIGVVSTERECEKEGVKSEFAEIGRKCVEVSWGGGRGRNGRFPGGMKKRGNKRVEKDLNIDEVEAGDFAVVSTERGGELKGNGKSLVVDGRVWEKKVMGGDVSVGVLGKFEGLSVRGGKGGNGRFARDMNSGSRSYIGGCGRVVNRGRVERLSASNLVWVKKEEGESSDANVARV